MAQTCPHGFSPSDCLICEALGTTGGRTKTATKAASSSGRGAKRHGSVVPGQVLAPDQRPTKRRGGGMSLAAVAIGLVIAVIAAVALAGVVFTLLRIFELVLVALAAGWVGYHIGLFRGSHKR